MRSINRDVDLAKRDKLDETLVLNVLGDRPSWRNPAKRMDYAFSSWVVKKCSGRNPVSPRLVFFRCLGCTKIVPGKQLRTGRCDCGSMRFSDNVGRIGTLKAFRLLVLGR